MEHYGIINLKKFIINDPYKIIFLGDIIDRGIYSLDILNIIFKLIINNNKVKKLNDIKIIFIRGNHETKYYKDGNYDMKLYKK